MNNAFGESAELGLEDKTMRLKTKYGKDFTLIPLAFIRRGQDSELPFKDSRLVVAKLHEFLVLVCSCSRTRNLPSHPESEASAVQLLLAAGFAVLYF